MEQVVNGFNVPATIRDDGWVRFGSDTMTNVTFYTRVVNDPEESRRRGAPYSRSVTYVRLQQPGEKDNVDRPVRGEFDDVIQRFPRQWQAFQAGKKPVPHGTPIEVLYPQTPEIAANLHVVGVHTVQQLANLNAHGIDTIGMGASIWKQKAVEFLKSAEGSVGYHRMQAENEKLQNTLEVQANQMSDMQAQINRLMAMQQGIPSISIKPAEATIAQMAHQEVVQEVTYVTDQAADPNGYGHVVIEDGSPLFDEPADSYGDEESAPVAPRRRGRPPKPRTEENV